MIASINSCIFTGNIVSDAKIRTTDKGLKIAVFSLAVDDAWTDRETGEVRKRVNFFDMQVMGKRAESLATHLTKGSRVAVRAQARWDRWNTAKGESRTSVTFRVSQVEFLSRPKAVSPAEVAQRAGSEATQEPAVPMPTEPVWPVDMDDVDAQFDAIPNKLPSVDEIDSMF